MITHGKKQISEIVYARKASEGGGTVRLTNIIRGAQVVFGGKVPFNVWLTDATTTAILAAFGVVDGKAVIKATNAYLNALAATDTTKASALAGFINEDPMLVCSLGLQPQGVDMPIRTLVGNGTSYLKSGFTPRSGVEFTITYHTFLVKYSSRQIEGWNSGQWWGINGNRSTFGQNGIGASFNVNELSEIQIRYTGSGGTPLYLNDTKAGGTPGFAAAEFNAYHINGWNNECMRDKRADVIIVENNSEVKHFIPYLNKTAEKVRWFDLLSESFGNQVGEFTEAFYLPDGTPWTPLNQTP